MRAMAFSMDLGGGVDLVLRESWTVEPLHRLIGRNLDRLRRWEAWAHGEQTEAGLRAFTRHELSEWVDGRGVPAALRVDRELVGAVGARIDGYAGTAALGYWVDADHEGRGLVTRAVTAMVDHLFVDRELSRAEIRTATHNGRSRALAERLGFLHEGTLRAAAPVGAERHDVAVYGLLPDTWKRARTTARDSLLDS